MNEKLVEQIRERLSDRDTNQLIEIWTKNDHEEWSNEAFEAVRLILLERGVNPPQQDSPIEPARCPSLLNCWLSSAKRDAMNEPADRRDNQLVYYMGLVYLAILCAITLTWHFGGWSEDNYWPYLLAWTSCLMVFALSCIFAALQKATLWAVGLLIVGGTLCFPLGVFALAMSAARILKWGAYPHRLDNYWRRIS